MFGIEPHLQEGCLLSFQETGWFLGFCLLFKIVFEVFFSFPVVCVLCSELSVPFLRLGKGEKSFIIQSYKRFVGGFW